MFQSFTNICSFSLRDKVKKEGHGAVFVLSILPCLSKICQCPISLLPCLSKILEKLICVRLVSFFKKNNFLQRYQFGFRQHISTSHALLDK